MFQTTNQLFFFWKICWSDDGGISPRDRDLNNILMVARAELPKGEKCRDRMGTPVNKVSVTIMTTTPMHKLTIMDNGFISIKLVS